MVTAPPPEDFRPKVGIVLKALPKSWHRVFGGGILQPDQIRSLNLRLFWSHYKEALANKMIMDNYRSNLIDKDGALQPLPTDAWAEKLKSNFGEKNLLQPLNQALSNFHVSEVIDYAISIVTYYIAITLYLLMLIGSILALRFHYILSFHCSR